MPGNNLPRRYRTLPGFAVAQSFLVHVHRTGKPETFPGICTDRAPDGWRFELVTPFEIIQSVRDDGALAPCPVCRPDSGKYLNGHLVWDRDALVLRAIGRDCGSNALKTERDEATERYYRRRAIQDAIREMRLWLPELANQVRHADNLKRSAEHAQFLRAKLRRDALTFNTELLDHWNHGADGITVIGLRGKPFLEQGYAPDKLRSEAEQILLELSVKIGKQGADGIDAWLTEPNQLLEVHRRHKTALRQLQLAEDQVLAASAFLDPANLVRIERWARATNKPIHARPASFGYRLAGPARHGKPMETILIVDHSRLTPPKRSGRRKVG